MIRKAFLNEFLHLWLTVSSLVIAVIYFVLNPSLNILGLKDLLVFAVLGMYLFFSREVDLRPFIVLGPLFLVLIFSSVFSPAPAFAIVASLRQLLVPFILIFCSYLATRSEEDLQRLYSKIYFNLWLLLIFGFAEKFFGFWQYIDLTNFFAAKNIPVNSDNIPYVFIEPIGDGIIRMSSFLLDPINLGHTLVCLLCIELFSPSRYRILKLGIILLGLIFTFCKGAIVQLLFIFVIFNTRIHMGIRIVITVSMAAGAVLLSAYHEGILIHFNGFIASFADISPFGGGMATAGNQSHMFAKDILKEGLDQDIGDSFIGAVIGQIGMVGLFFWILPFFQLTRDFGTNDIFKRVLLSQLVIACISENSFNLLSIYSVCIIVGGKLALSAKKDHDEQKEYINSGSGRSKSGNGLLQQQPG
jgi:hypothetical protein